MHSCHARDEFPDLLKVHPNLITVLLWLCHCTKVQTKDVFLCLDITINVLPSSHTALLLRLHMHSLLNDYNIVLYCVRYNVLPAPAWLEDERRRKLRNLEKKITLTWEFCVNYKSAAFIIWMFTRQPGCETTKKHWQKSTPNRLRAAWVFALAAN